MRRLIVVLFVLALAALGAPTPPARAQPGADLIYSKHRQFWIPFSVGAGKQTLNQLQLYVSTDLGKTWQSAAVAAPDQERFRFVSPADGLYWFSVQTIDKDNKPFPATMDNAKPSLRVFVDTVPPQVTLKALQSRDGEVGVAWTIQDDHYDPAQPDAFRLEYRQDGALGWTPLFRKGPANQLYWAPGVAGPLEVRLRVKDRAGNEGQQSVKMTPGDGQGVFQGGPADPPPPVPPGDPDRRLINSKMIHLNFEIKDKGPSGISTLELWFTQDGRNWSKYNLPKKDDEVMVQSPLKFKVEEEGLYGFTLVARSGVGLGERPPQVGDKPQVWVEVDLTKPVVKLQQVVVGQGAEKGKLAITWTATDRNLGPQPISLSYAEKPDGPWTPLTDNKLSNSGKYIWAMPPDLPYQFLVRVEAADLAGNVGEAVTPSLVKVDLSLPKVKILKVEPGNP